MKKGQKGQNILNVILTFLLPILLCVNIILGLLSCLCLHVVLGTNLSNLILVFLVLEYFYIVQLVWGIRDIRK